MNHSCELRDPLVDWSHDLLGSDRSGPFRVSRAWSVPSYFDDNLVASRHWQPPGDRSGH